MHISYRYLQCYENFYHGEILPQPIYLCTTLIRTRCDPIAWQQGFDGIDAVDINPKDPIANSVSTGQSSVGSKGNTGKPESWEHLVDIFMIMTSTDIVVFLKWHLSIFPLSIYFSSSTCALYNNTVIWASWY